MPIMRHYTNEYEKVIGSPPPAEPFPAWITGIALPQFPYRKAPNVGLQEPYPECSDAPDIWDCTPPTSERKDINGLYPPVLLPCGLSPVRYRWQAEHSGLSSEGCGPLLNPADGLWHPWRGYMWAVNTAHAPLIQDAKLNYPYVTPSTPVLMGWGDISYMTGESQRFGFFFNHHDDPPGTRRCPPMGQFADQGCCLLYWGVPGYGDVVSESCMTEVDCLALGESLPAYYTEWLGSGTDCPGYIGGPAQECVGLQEGPPEPGGPPGKWGGRRLVTSDHKLGGCAGWIG